MAKKKRTIKTAKAKKPTEKIEKVDIPAPEQEIIEDDASMLPKKDLFRIDEVADYFSVTERTVRLWIDHGHLKATEKTGAVRILRGSILKCRILDNRKIL